MRAYYLGVKGHRAGAGRMSPAAGRPGGRPGSSARSRARADAVPVAQRHAHPPGTTSPPLTSVPFDEPGSSTAQAPSGSAVSTACRWETPGSSGRAGQVDLGFEPAGHAAPPDPHLPPGQPEPALGAVPGELD